MPLQAETAKARVPGTRGYLVPVVQQTIRRPVLLAYREVKVRLAGHDGHHQGRSAVADQRGGGGHRRRHA